MTQSTQSNALVLELGRRELLLRQIDHRSKCFGVVDRKCRKNLSVDLNVGLGQTINQTAISWARLTDGGVDSDVPQPSEHPLSDRRSR